VKLDGRALKRDRLDQHGRGQRVDARGLRVDDRDALLRREPEATVARFNASRQPPAVALDVEHPVPFPVGDAVDACDATVGEVVQLAAADSIDALVTANPEVAVTVFENLKDAVVEKPLLHPVVEET